MSSSEEESEHSVKNSPPTVTRRDGSGWPRRCGRHCETSPPAEDLADAPEAGPHPRRSVALSAPLPRAGALHSREPARRLASLVRSLRQSRGEEADVLLVENIFYVLRVRSRVNPTGRRSTTRAVLLKTNMKQGEDRLTCL